MFNQNRLCELSIVSEKYLNEFECILQNMSDKMLSCMNYNSITILFIKQMIPHHKAAIKMCENLLQYTTNIKLQNLALNIIKTQKSQIEQMRSIEAESECDNNKSCQIEMYMNSYNSITKSMIAKMNGAPRLNNINLNFINEMIPHHQGAIRLCENALKFPVNHQLKHLMNTIITDQTRGIRELKCIRQHIFHS